MHIMLLCLITFQVLHYPNKLILNELDGKSVEKNDKTVVHESGTFNKQI